MKKIFSTVAVVALAFTFAVAPTASALTAADIQLLVSMGVIPADKAAAAMAALGGTSTTTSTTSCGSYTRDLTLGSTGADVVALQSFLESKGHLTIPAGTSKGYFGALTQSALAKYQAAVMISPAAGYFGPMTRAKVSGDCSTTGTGTGTGTGTSTGTLSGDEASLNSYDRKNTVSNEDVREGETAKVFAAEFEVEDGDAQIERVDVRIEAVTENLEDEPWNQIESMAILVNGEEIDSMNVDDEDAWSREDSSDSSTTAATRAYEVRFTDLDTVVEEGEDVLVEVEITASDSIDDSEMTQSWKVWIPTEGIRAIDGKGIDQYTGSNSESTEFEIEAADDGELSVRESDDDLDSQILVVDLDDKKGPYEVFRFELDNSDDAAVLINTLTVSAVTNDDDITDVISELTVEIDGEEYNYDTASTTLPATVGQYTFDFEDNGDEIEIDEDTTVEVVVMAEFNKTTGNYSDGTTVQFGVGKVNGANLDTIGVVAEGVATGDGATESGRQEGSTHTLRTTGIVIESVSEDFEHELNLDTTSADNRGIFTFEVKITALEDDAYIPDSATSSVSVTTAGFVASTTGAAFDLTGADLGTSSARISDTSADTKVGGRWKVSEGTSETFTVVVELDPVGAPAAYGMDLTKVYFSSTSDGTLASYTVPDEPEFSIPTVTIQSQ